MKFKKIVSAALAGAMALSMTATAFASDNTTLARSSEITGTTQAPTINITVPTTGAVTVNPYKMGVTVDGNAVTDQIISATQYIKNESNVAVKVAAEVTGKTSGKLALATATTQGGKAVTTNSVFMYFEMDAATADDGSGDPTWGTAYDSKSPRQILVGTKATKKADMLILGAGDTAATYAAYHLAGDAASTPTTAWTADDKVDVTIAFTFTPTTTPVASGS